MKVGNFASRRNAGPALNFAKLLLARCFKTFVGAENFSRENYQMMSIEDHNPIRAKVTWFFELAMGYFGVAEAISNLRYYLEIDIG